ncbi:hypothetical protein SAMN05660841_02971 [Sphingobacterium nematocida]|uniref:Uncharacterized protein n=1 Tax=Sphingobacterium nematocida TaxID=1513896 RepID=A0A1T5F2U6_9SPHI|nr:hypothetical protein [Sphingobacterium nematocida]SKB90505.1 hypothetical protein SAMN05660841_02971 [Sphingobacterium nematocida]
MKFRFNNVDTISALNRGLIDFFGKYIETKSAGKDDADFWSPQNNFNLPRNDSYEPWLYSMFSYRIQTILGLSKVSDNQYNVKVMLETNIDSASTMVYAIQNYIIKETSSGLKMQDILGFRLDNENYQFKEDQYFDFYYPKDYPFSAKDIDQINNYVRKIETYFGKELPFKLRYIYAPGCEALFYMRGYDYVANMMSTKSTVCGLTDPKNRILFSSDAMLHKHELLRLLTVLYPKYPAIVMDGFTNLVGGAAGKPIMYHLRKLAPYILENPKILDDLNAFYYYDDETNPHFVFNAIATNYFIEKKGEQALKEFMRREDSRKDDVASFLKKYCGVEDVKSFFLQQFKTYADTERDLEFINIL